MELTQSTQPLHQQTTGAVNDIARFSSLQENLHFINDIPIFKAEESPSLDEWLEQTEKVESFMNKDPCKVSRFIQLNYQFIFGHSGMEQN